MVKALSKKIILFVISAAVVFSGWHAAYAHDVRVEVVKDAESLNFRVNGRYEVQDVSRKVLYRGSKLNTTITAYGESILIGKMSFDASKIFIKPEDDDDIAIGERKFKGMAQFIKKENGHISAINYIGLEEYIKGVLYHEASHYWPVEALKAQAIISRTFAVRQMQVNSAMNYDVTSDVYSQVYGGKTSERYRTNKAVNGTQGLVLTYQGKILPAYFHATCAGHTEDVSLLWDVSSPPLKGVVCGFCKDSPHFSWHAVFSRYAIKQKLSKAGYKIDAVKDITINGRDESARVTSLKISGDKQELNIPAKVFRNMMGSDIIRSTNFTVDVNKDGVAFEGFGWGHGVGLCQWGAYFMAKEGRRYQEILKHYYPGSDVETLRF
jgi:stage II sporulation protein D